VLHLLHSRRMLQLVHRLLQPAAERAAGGTQLGLLLQAGGWPTFRRRSTVFVVSDFISAPGWEKPLAQLAQRHDVVAVRLFDPLELELPDLGLVLLRDAETGEQLQVDTHDKAFRQRFAACPPSARPPCAPAWPRGRRHAGAAHR
jgi:hypothetical protein